MSRYIPESLRQFVTQRAEYRCEYCHSTSDEVFFPFQIDHIISLKHGGSTTADNLAYACFVCNNAKGSDIGTILFPDNRFTRLFNPRTDKWHEHFVVENGVFYSDTLIGKATIKVLNLNDIERIIERVEQ